jgi:hypothetical protein
MSGRYAAVPISGTCVRIRKRRLRPATAFMHSRVMQPISETEKLEAIRRILAEPVPRWFQNDHRRANAYAEQLRRIAAVLDD